MINLPGPAPTIKCRACGQTIYLVNLKPGFGEPAYFHATGPRCPMDGKR